VVRGGRGGRRGDSAVRSGAHTCGRRLSVTGTTWAPANAPSMWCFTGIPSGLGAAWLVVGWCGSSPSPQGAADAGVLTNPSGQSCGSSVPAGEEEDGGLGVVVAW
jgi:hypothetical protein